MREARCFPFQQEKFLRYHTEAGTFQTRSKHGNYNAWFHAIGFERYEIIAAFDPDHVPEPTFLAEELGYFNDPEVGYVQAAQSSTISRRVLSPVVRLKKHMYFILPSRCPLMPLGTQS